jgi:hypothetical protein
LRRRPVAVDGAILVIALAFVFITAPSIASGFGLGVRQLSDSIGASLGAQQGSGVIELPSGIGNVGGAEPVVNGLPDFTREPALQLSGRVPSFAVQTGRTVEIVLNAAVVANAELDPTGAFAAPMTLRDGANAIGLTLLSGRDAIARSSYTVVLDRQPPTLTITRPKDNETIAGPNVVVEGKAEVGATVSVNGRTVVPSQDGAFSESFTPAVGPVAITVIARDRAGNETTTKANVTLKPAAATATTAVSVTLDRSKVRPSEAVLAEIRVTENGLPKTGTLVTLSVGVITIGTATTDASGIARIGFAAPPNEGDASVVVLAAGAAGRASLTIAR